MSIKTASFSILLTAFLILTLPLSSAYAQDITTGLIGHWKFDETSGTTAYDSSGNGNDGTMLNGLDASSNFATGVVGTSIDFAGGTSDQAIELTGVSLGTTNTLTLTGWTNADAPTATYYAGIIFQRDGLLST